MKILAKYPRDKQAAKVLGIPISSVLVLRAALKSANFGKKPRSGGIADLP
jgi:hypothetical protein